MAALRRSTIRALTRRAGWLLALSLVDLSVARVARAQASDSGRVEVTITSACTCKKCHQEWRKAQKDEPDAAPASSAIPQSHHITPTTLAGWAGPGGTFTETTARSVNELEWYVLTGRVTLLKVEADEDLHIQLESVHHAADDTVQAIVDVPLGKPWCAIRQEVFGWTNASFPLTPFTSGKGLTLNQTPVISVTGRAFYDAEHAPPPHHDSSKNLRRRGRGRRQPCGRFIRWSACLSQHLSTDSRYSVVRRWRRPRRDLRHRCSGAPLAAAC